MKRCDLHIHTVQSISDWEFTFDKDILVDYVSKTGLDVIAITNHNQFDYAQFLEIKECLPNITVLPGIEVDLEKDTYWLYPMVTMVVFMTSTLSV